VMRTLSSLEHYFVTTSASALVINQYATSTIRATVGGAEIGAEVTTDYPWNGNVEVTITKADGRPWTLALRIPAWAVGASVFVNGADATVPVEVGRYVRLERPWVRRDTVTLKLPMNPRLTRAHRQIDASRGCVAIERGPLVYCLEQLDQPGDRRVDDLSVAKGDLVDKPASRDLPGVVAVEAPGRLQSSDEDHQNYATNQQEDVMSNDPVSRGQLRLSAIPYFTWANRGTTPMRVWIPES